MATVTGQPARAATAARCPAVYRRRNPRATPLYQLLDAHFDALKAQWDDRFEHRFGFWRGFYDTAVASYLDCGLLENGFARVRCPQCASEFLVAFSCKGRGLCPSCGAKRAALFSALLQEHLLDDVPHAQWVFSIPKMLRPYFLHHRELLGELARISYDTVREFMAAAVDEPHARPGMLAVIQTFGSSLRWNPHIHAVVSRGVWDPGPRWHPIPYVDPHKAELLFRHKVFRLLLDRELISQDRIDLLLSWRHSGFSVHNRTTVYPSDTEGIHKLACYLMRPPVNLSRLRYHPDSGLVLYEPKNHADVDDPALTDPLEFLARVLIHIPEPRKHLVHFYGAYANRVRSSFRITAPADDDPSSAKRRLSKRWAELIYRVYEVDPLTCPCGARMTILAFIIQPDVIRKILQHLETRHASPRAPPHSSTVL